MSVIRIASFDGGGVRGVIQSVVAERIEQIIGKPLLQQFHLSAGTSAGAINMAGYATPKGATKPLHSATEIKNLFLGAALQEVFKKNNSSKLADAFFLPFKNENKSKVFEATYNTPYREKYGQDLWLSGIEDYMLIPAFYPETDKAFIMSTKAAKKNEKQDFRLSDAVNAATAVPGYFDLPIIKNKSGKEHLFGDGGFAAKNPAGIAFNEANRVWGLGHKFLIVSFGTGQQSKNIPTKSLSQKSQGWWALRSHYSFMNTQSNLVLKELSWKKNVNIIRFDIDFATIPADMRPDHNMANASPANMQRLKHAADVLLSRDVNKKQIDALAKIFKHEKTSPEKIRKQQLVDDPLTRLYSYIMRNSGLDQLGRGFERNM